MTKQTIIISNPEHCFSHAKTQKKSCVKFQVLKRAPPKNNLKNKNRKNKQKKKQKAFNNNIILEGPDGV